MKNKKVLVTGGLGFIGSHLVEELSQDNFVLILDDESSGRIANIKHLDLENISVDLADITTADLDELLDSVDYVFHLAALASVPKSVADPLLCNRVNSTGTLKLLTAARDNGVKKLVFSSSTAVYGESGKLPLTEDAPLQPRSPYAASKIASEYYCQVFSEIYDLSTISLRYFNVYGPRQDPNSQYAAAVPKFMEAFIKGNNPVIYGDGEQTRDFIYVKDVVKANIHFCESSYTGQYQIASGKSISINQLCDILQELFQTQTTPLYKDPRPGDIKHSVADTSKALEAGYKSETDFMTGLKETIDSLNL